MSHETVKTIKVQPWGKNQGAFVEINECDFDDQKHKLFTVNVVPPAPVPVPQTIIESNATVKALELATEAGIDIATIVGTGNNGKVTVPDVELAIEKLTNSESE